MENKGLGDTIKIITNFIGFRTCEACEKRRVYFNSLVSYVKKEPIFSEELITKIDTFLLEEDVTKTACKFYNEIMMEYDGIWSDSCFCTKSQRTAMRKEFKTWYKNKLV